jgi:homoserine dehydrogenase
LYCLSFGKGAGGHPTGSAVLSDIAALRYDYQYEYKKTKASTGLNFTNDVELNIYLRYEDEELVNLLAFKTINERYYSGTYKYVTGKVNLQKLIDNESRIYADKAFIAFADQLTGVSLGSVKK